DRGQPGAPGDARHGEECRPRRARARPRVRCGPRPSGGRGHVPGRARTGAVGPRPRHLRGGRDLVDRGARMTRRAADQLHAAAMVVAALGTAAYWTAYFAAGTVQTATDAVYVGFEDAFPLADAYMAACFVLAAWHLRRGRGPAVLFGIAAGSAMIFLGAMDMLFNLKHGKYAAMTAEMALEAAINVVCLVFGPFTMVRLWRARARLAGV